MSVVLATSSVTPAVAAGELGLSLDGVHWMPSISTPLFDPSVRWVPGDSATASFFVRNQAGSRGDLTVDILGSTVGDLIESGDLHITAKGGGGDWTTISEGGTHRLLTAPKMGDGQTNEIKVNVTFDSSSTNPTQMRASELSFRVTLTQSGLDSGVDDARLPDTGAPDLRLYAALSAILLGTGLGFVRRRSDSQREVHHV